MVISFAGHVALNCLQQILWFNDRFLVLGILQGAQYHPMNIKGFIVDFIITSIFLLIILSPITVLLGYFNSSRNPIILAILSGIGIFIGMEILTFIEGGELSLLSGIFFRTPYFIALSFPGLILG